MFMMINLKLNAVTRFDRKQKFSFKKVIILWIIISLQVVKTEILRELHLLGQRDGLKSFEQVKDIHVHHEMFSIENGLITPTLKTKV